MLAKYSTPCPNSADRKNIDTFIQGPPLWSEMLRGKFPLARRHRPACIQWFLLLLLWKIHISAFFFLLLTLNGYSEAGVFSDFHIGQGKEAKLVCINEKNPSRSLSK